MRLNDLRTDPAKEKDGVLVSWVGDVEFKLRRIGNEDYRRAVADGLKPYRAQIRADALPFETLEKIQREAHARHVLVGWKGLTDKDGTPIPYTPETAAAIFEDPGHHDFYEFVITSAARMENFRAEEAKEDLGNSPSFSTGSKNGAHSRSSSESSQEEDAESTPSTANRSSRRGSKRRGRRSATTTSPGGV